MKRIILENVRLMLLATVFSLGLGIAFAWTDPASAPPTGNALTPLNRSASPQVKAGGLWASSFGVDNGLVVMGNLGVGTLTPSSKLSVTGTIESTSGGFKFPDGTVQDTAVAPYVAPPVATSTPTYIAFYSNASAGTYTINLNTGVVSGGTLTFLGGTKFPVGSVALGMAMLNGYNVGFCQMGNGEYAQVNGGKVATISDVTQNITFTNSAYGCAGASAGEAIFIGR